MEINEISTKVNGGTLVAYEGGDPYYPSISIGYKTDSGDWFDIVVVECKSENNNQDIDVYTYDDVCVDDYQRKFTLRKKDIDQVLSLEN